MLPILHCAYIVLSKEESERVSAFEESIKACQKEYPTSSYFLFNYLTYVNKINYVKTKEDTPALLAKIYEKEKAHTELKTVKNFNKKDPLIITS